MAEGKDIPISIRTTADTSGAKATEESLRKIGEAAKSASADNPMLAGKAEADARRKAAEDEAKAIEAQAAAMEKAAAASKELEAGLAEISEELDEIADSSEEANEQGRELDENVKNIARVQKAQAVADLARQVGEIGNKFREAAAEVEDFDKEAAASMRATADRIDQVSSAVSTLAMGFAVGGPVGAGVAALALGVKALVDAFKDSEVAVIKAGAVQRKAMEEAADAARKAAVEAADRARELKSDEIENAIRRQNSALEEGLDTLRNQVGEARKRRQEEEEVLKSKDKLEFAKIDKAEASGEIDSEEAAKQRINVEQGAIDRARDERKRQAAIEAAAAEQAAQKEKAAADAADAAVPDAKAAEEEAKAARELAEKKVEYVRLQKIVEAAEEDLNKSRASNFTTAGDTQKARRGLEFAESERDKVEVPFDPFLSEKTAKEDLETAKKEFASAKENREKLELAAREQQERAAAAEKEAGGKKTDFKETVKTVDTSGRFEDEAKRMSREADEIRDRKRREKAEQERAARERLEAEADAAREKLEGTAGANRSRIRNSDKGQSSAALRGLADDIGMADTTAEIQAVRDAVKAKSGEMTAAMVQAMEAMMDRQESLVKRVDNLTERLRRK
ncbi:MAG: hypothetical protein ABJQ29_11400 [Luteolibacter sp.]